MRIKILKKVLAIMIAGSMVVATPGLSMSVIASGKEKKSATNKKTAKKKNSKKGAKKENRKEEEKSKTDFDPTSLENFRIESIESIDFEAHDSNTSDASKQENISKFVELLKKGINNEQDTRNFVDIFHKLLTTTNFFEKYKDVNPLNSAKFIKILLKCQLTDEIKAKIVQIIDMLASKNLLQVFSKQDVQFVAEWIFNCPIDNNIKKDLLKALLNLLKHSFWFQSNQKEPISNMLRFLKQCFDDQETKKNILEIIKTLLDKEFINTQNCGSQIVELTNILKNCESQECDVRKQVASLINSKLSLSNPDNLGKDTISLMVRILSECSNSSDARPLVLDSVEKLTNQKFLKDSRKNETTILLNILNKCKDDSNAKKRVTASVEKLISQNLLINFSKDEIITLLIMLRKCIDSSDAQEFVAASIQKLIKQKLLKDFDKNEIKALLNILFKCKDSKNAKQFIADSIGNLIGQNLLNKFCEGDINDLLIILKNCVDSSDAKEFIAASIKVLICHKLFYKNEIKVLLNILIGCRDSKNAKQFIAASIEKLAHKNLLKDFCQRDIKILLSILKTCTDSGDAQEFIAGSIYELISHNLLKNLSKNEIKELTLYTLFKCIDSDDAKEFIAASIYELISQNLLKDFDKKETIILLVILYKCKDYNNAKEFVAASIEQLIEQGLLKDFDKQEITALLNVLQKCADSDDAKQNVTSSILSLSEHDFLSEHYSREDIGRIFDILKKCSTLKSEKRSVLKAISSLTSKKLFREFDQKSQLINLLNDCVSDDDDATYALAIFWTLATGKTDILDNDNKLYITKIFSFKENSHEIFKFFESVIKFLDLKSEAVCNIQALIKENFFTSHNINDINALVDLLEKCAGIGSDKILIFTIRRLCEKQFFKCYENEKGILNLLEIFFAFGGIKKVLNANPKQSLSDLLQNYGKKYELNFNLKLTPIKQKKCDSKKEKSTPKSLIESGQTIIMDTIQNINKPTILEKLNCILQFSSNEQQKNNMAYYVSDLIEQKKQLIVQSQDIDQLIQLLKKCVGSDCSNKFVAKTIESLVLKNWQGEYSKDQFKALTDILAHCSKSQSSKNFVAKIVNILISKKQMTNANQKLISKFINILSDCLYDSEENMEFVAQAIEKLATLGLLNGCEKVTIANIFKKIYKCVKNNANSLKHVARAVRNFVQNNPLALKQASKEMNNSDKKFIYIFINLLNQCSAIEHEDVVWSIKSLFEKGLLCEKNKDQVLNAIDVVSRCVSAEGVTTSIIANELIEDLFDKSFLETISDSKQIPQVVNRLFDLLNQGVNKMIVLNLVKKLVAKSDFNYKKLSQSKIKKIRIYDILNACSDSKDCKSAVLEIMRNLAKNDILTQKNIFKKENIINLLNKHSGNLSANDQKSLFEIITSLKDNSWLDLDQFNEDQIFIIIKIIAEDLDWNFGEIFNQTQDDQIQDDQIQDDQIQENQIQDDHNFQIEDLLDKDLLNNL